MWFNYLLDCKAQHHMDIFFLCSSPPQSRRIYMFATYLRFFLVECSSLKVLDIVLTNYRVLLLTDHGLFFSAETHRTTPKSLLVFHVMWKSAGCDIIEVGSCGCNCCIVSLLIKA